MNQVWLTPSEAEGGLEERLFPVPEVEAVELTVLAVSLSACFRAKVYISDEPTSGENNAT